VRAAAADLDYVPNLAAQTMRREASRLVGLIVPDIENAFYARVAKVLTARCARDSYQLVLAVTDDDPKIELRHLRGLREARATGVAIAPTVAPEAESLTLLRRTCTVQIVRAVDGIDAPRVQIAEHAGIFAAARRLIDAGHRRIAYIGGPAALSTGEARLRGYRDALAAAGITTPKAFVRLGIPRAEFGQTAMSELIRGRERPGAVILGGYELTVGALRPLLSEGLKVPDDITVVGYGDPLLRPLWMPGLVLIAPPVQQFASAAADVLLARITDPSAPVEPPIEFAPSLV
jgi:LacI family transcriptional regulator